MKDMNEKRHLSGLLTWALLLSLFITTHAHASVAKNESKGLVPEDYFDFVFLNSPQVSPNNEDILFVKRTVNDDASGRNSQVFKIDKSGVVSEFTQGTGDRAPQWSPDGSRVAFIRSVDGKSQVFVMPANGGEAKQVTFVEQSLSSFQWMPSGEQLLLTLTVSPEKENEALDSKSENKRTKPDIVVVKNARYIGDGAGYLSDKRRHLFTYDLESQALTQLTEGSDWNVNGPTLSKDGQYVYFHANKTGLEYEGNDNSDIYRLNIKTKQQVALTQHQGSQYSVSVSYDGKSVVYSHQEDTYEQADLFLQRGNSKPKNLTAAFDRRASGALWSPTNKSLYFTTSDHGAHRLFAVDTGAASVKKLLDIDKTVRNLAIAPSGKFLVFTLESSTALPELYRYEIQSKKLQKLTQFNDALIASKALSPAESFWFENELGMKVQGFVHKPINFDKNKSYPLVLNIKGGPGGMWGHQWFHENQMYAAKGYGVVYVNYRGSSGYGIAHSKAVRKDYGGADYRDNMQFLDKVIAQNSWINKDALYITGGSHGGFLTNWITTKTDRFKAAVTQRSVSSWISEAGTQEYTPAQMTKEFGGTLWTNFAGYWDRSPLKYADQVSTPTLIIHSDQDMVTPIGQGQEWFYALKANDVPVEMVIFKGETHGLSRTGTPTNLVERLDRILDWFSRH